jgi:hypothetical protein
MDRPTLARRWYWPEFLNAGTVEPGWYIVRFKIHTPTIGLALCGPLSRTQAQAFANRLNNGGRR